MKASEYLRQLKNIDIIISQKTEELETVRATVVSTGVAQYGTEKICTSSTDNNARFVKLCNKAIDLENEISEELCKYLEMKHTIINQIQGLNNIKHSEILYLKFVKFKKMDEIAETLDYSNRQVYRLYKAALVNFGEKYFGIMSLNVSNNP